MNSKNEPVKSGLELLSKQENIFGQSLNAGQMKTKKTRYLEEKNRKKAILTLGVSLVALMLYSTFFFYGNVSVYLKAPGEISRLKNEIKNYQEVIVPSLQKTKDLHKAAYDKEFQEVISALDNVFPKDIDKLGIVRLFESFSSEVAVSFPPFEFTSITLGNPEKKADYTVVPVSTSIHSSLTGFDRFLSLVDHSGNIYSQKGEDKIMIDKQIRLMNISSISVKYRGIDEKTGKDQGVDFSVRLNIYSRSNSEQK